MRDGRRHEISRVEAFSDAAFAFALTLLVVSLEVPRSYGELVQRMRGLPSFACCFALLVWIWHEHNLFFRRYGLQDALTVVINSSLLFVVLFYVYPLKFMFDSMFEQLMPMPGSKIVRMSLPELAHASTIYGLGFVVLFVLFALLYLRAYAMRTALALTPVEVFEAKAFVGHHLVSSAVGVIAVLVAVAAPLRFAPLSPMCFALMGPGHMLMGMATERRRKALFGSQVPSPRARSPIPDP
jgi:uncharacterized membrane protein